MQQKSVTKLKLTLHIAQPISILPVLCSAVQDSQLTGNENALKVEVLLSCPWNVLLANKYLAHKGLMITEVKVEGDLTI
jgi:hypothetical protein